MVAILGDALGQVDWSQPIQQGINNLISGTNPITSGDYYNKLGEIDITAPGAATKTGTNPFFDATQQYLQPTLDAATNIYNQGPADLNPLQESYYNQVAQLTQPDAYGQQLASNAAQATGTAFGSAGSIGSARNYQAANNAATQLLADRAKQHRDELATAGQNYYNWQNTADWDWLNQYQDASGFGQNIPGSETSVTAPSGADLYNAQLGAALAANALNSGQIPGVSAGPTVSSGEWYSPILNAGAGAVVGGIAGGVSDWISDWF